jgi:hypothetical protein
MVGYGWVSLGTGDILTSPTCGATNAAITNAAPCATDVNWSGTGLCMTGSVSALAAANPDYSGSFGVEVGVTSTNGGLGQSFASITIAVAGSPSTGLRALVHRVGDPNATSYCLPYASGAMALTSFSTACWSPDAPGTALTPADVPNIDRVILLVPSTQTAEITVTSLCITGITFQ